ncbi:MAG: hypothetical protein M3Y57_11990 [Acidobacteriota bacterium]|nr:hypothetical protein [Acidobacteriota bacterium]
MLNRASITHEPLESGNQQLLRTDPDTRRENERNRIEETGSGAELFRRAQLAHLRAHFEAFCEHGSSTDIAALCATFGLMADGWSEPANCPRQQATIVECLLVILGLSPDALLESETTPDRLWTK